MNRGLALLGALMAVGLASSRSSTPGPGGRPSTGPLPRSTFLAPGYTLGEFLVSASRPELASAIVPTDVQLDHLAATAAVVSQLASAANAHLRITSGLRSPALNDAVGGADGSQHMLGEAVDIEPPAGMTSAGLARIALKAGVPFDQLIAYTPGEGGHLHLSYTTRHALRRQVGVIDGSGFHDDGDPQTTLARWRNA